MSWKPRSWKRRLYPASKLALRHARPLIARQAALPFLAGLQAVAEQLRALGQAAPAGGAAGPATPPAPSPPTPPNPRPLALSAPSRGMVQRFETPNGRETGTGHRGAGG